MSLRVTFLVSSVNLNTGGGSHRTFDLTATALRQLGFDIRVLALEGEGSPVGADVPYAVHVEDGWKRPTRFQRLRAVAEILRRYERETDVFHVFGPSWGPAAGLYRSAGHVPVIVTLNSYTWWCTNLGRMDGLCHRRCGLLQRVLHARSAPSRKIVSLPTRMLEHFVAVPWARHVDHFLPDSPSTKRTYEEAGFDLSRSTIIPEVIDFSAIREAAGHPRITRAGRGGPRDVLYIGRLTAAKGVDLLLDAVPRIATPVRLHIAGDGPERATLEDRARLLGIADRVTFHGWVPHRQVWDLLQQVDVFVHPGRWPEPFGRTVVEAMALGVPTLVSSTGGPPWLVGPYGRTFAPGDPADLAVELDRLCSQYECALTAAERGIQRAAEFDYRRWVPMIGSIYESVMRDSLAPLSRTEARYVRPS